VQLTKAYDIGLGLSDERARKCLAAKSAVRAVVVVVVLPLLQFLGEEVASSMTWPSRSRSSDRRTEGWTSAKVGMLAEHLAGRALAQIGVRQGAAEPGHSDFQDHDAPHMTPHMVSIGP
jgi:hypothetical protein